MLFNPLFILPALGGLSLARPVEENAQAIVTGKVFDRFAIVYLENKDFATAMADPNMVALAKQGITLNNYFSVTHPSQPNYVASVGGDYFGMNNDNLNHVPENVSSIVDLLEDKGISWGEYQEDMPSTGFADMQFLNPTTGKNDYVRKHNPLISYDSVANVPARSSQIKNFTLFSSDLANNKLPQWMFITPNMTNDGHDSDMITASTFARNFLGPLLTNKNFNTNRTLVLLTFDENGSDDPHNRIFSILLGGAVPKQLVGTSDNNYYDHYSELATVEANWGLHTLGRYDVGANVFNFVAQQTLDTVKQLSTTDLNNVFLNSSYPGIFNTNNQAPLPIPNTQLFVNGRAVLPKIVTAWGTPQLQKCTVYNGSLIIPSTLTPPIRPAGC